MKILVIAPNPFFIDRGFSVRVYDQISELQKKGHKVVVTTYNSGRNISGINIRRIPNLPGYGAEDLGAKFSRLYLNLFLFFISFITTIKFKPDIIHAHLHEGALIGIIISRFMKIPVILDAQGSLTGELKDRGTIKNILLLKIIRKLENFIVHNVNFIIVSSLTMNKILKNNFGVSEENIQFLPDGVNTEMFNINKVSKLNKKYLSLPQNKKIVVYLGILHEYYGTDCLLEAIQYITSRRDDIHFLILGYPNVEKYKKIAESLNIAKNITFCGRIEYTSIPEYLKLADIAVAPKLGGTEANLKLEHYMACGLPVVCFDTIMNREVLGNLGIYAELGNPEALGEKILTTLQRDDLKELGIKLRKRVEEKFALNITANNLLSIYYSTINSFNKLKNKKRKKL